MTTRSDAELVAALKRPGFTPAQRDVGGLVGLVVAGVEPVATNAGPVLAGLGKIARAAIAARELAGGLDDAAQARLVAVLGLIARGGDHEARMMVLAKVRDAALPVRARRAAIVATGKLGSYGSGAARGALIERWDAGGVTADERRALAEALGKLGGDAALARLRALDPGADKELARRRDRAVLIAGRDAQRDTGSSIATDVPPPLPLRVRLHCKPGLAGLLADELRAAGLTPIGTTVASVDVVLEAPWATLFASRLWSVAGVRIPLAHDTPQSIVAAVIAAKPLLVAWTRGPIRWRLDFATGHRRAVVWKVAHTIAALAPELVNDPTETTWDVVLVEDDDRALELVPRRAHDPRFTWRRADVPASSHPTVAAAIARVGGARDGDRVWDPFCGAGAELIERARLGPYATLTGGDIDATALAAATANLEAAGVTATLAAANVLEPGAGPEVVDLVLTNPPLGGRIRGNAGKLLCDALPVIVGKLAPGGRLAWITPAPKRTGVLAQYLGLKQTFEAAVDLGGVRGVLERWEKR